MMGRVTKFLTAHGIGVIAAEDGRKFRFTANELTNRSTAVSGVEVDFLLSAGRPTQIIPLDGTPWTAFGGIEQD